MMLKVARAASEVARTGNRTLKGGGNRRFARAGEKPGPVGFQRLHLISWPPVQSACGPNFAERRALRSGPAGAAGQSASMARRLFRGAAGCPRSKGEAETAQRLGPGGRLSPAPNHGFKGAAPAQDRNAWTRWPDGRSRLLLLPSFLRQRALCSSRGRLLQWSLWLSRARAWKIRPHIGRVPTNRRLHRAILIVSTEVLLSQGTGLGSEAGGRFQQALPVTGKSLIGQVMIDVRDKDDQGARSPAIAPFSGQDAW